MIVTVNQSTDVHVQQPYKCIHPIPSCQSQTASIAFEFDKLSIELSSMDETQHLSPLLENLYQLVASDALADFVDAREVDDAFQRLHQRLHRQHQTTEPCEQETRSHTTAGEELGSRVPINKEPATNLTQEHCTVQRGSFERLDLYRRPVRERRQLFEFRADPSSDSTICSAKRLKRTNSLKDKKLFWESRFSGEAVAEAVDICPNADLSPKRKYSRAVSLKEKRKFWESIARQDEASEVRPLKSDTSGAKAAEPLKPASSAPLASPEAALSDSEHSSNPESRPECDQDEPECEQAVEVFERSIVTPATTVATTGYDNISLDELFYSMTHQTDSRSEMHHLAPCSRSGSHDDGGFIYDEFDEFNNIGEYDCKAEQQTDIGGPAPLFQLNSRLGKMFGVALDKALASGSGLFSGHVNVTNFFTVRTAGAGPGFLTVGVHGAAGTADMITQRCVSEDAGVYEVGYTVSRPGYYMIFVRWADLHIRDSPFVSQISDPAAIM